MAAISLRLHFIQLKYNFVHKHKYIQLTQLTKNEKIDLKCSSYFSNVNMLMPWHCFNQQLKEILCKKQ